MGARQKLNGAHITACIFIGFILFAMSGSGTIFLFATVGLLVASLVSGNIRPDGFHRRPRR